MSLKICHQCQLTIKDNENIYKGYDLSFCSPTCRLKTLNKLGSYPAPLYNQRNLENVPTNTLKKKKSYSTILIDDNGNTPDQKNDLGNSKISVLNNEWIYTCISLALCLYGTYNLIYFYTIANITKILINI
jgi:hypothetical protein